jgi:hypothetical protein
MVVNNPALLRPLPAPAHRRRPPGRVAGLRTAATFAGPAFLVSIGYMTRATGVPTWPRAADSATGCSGCW